MQETKISPLDVSANQKELERLASELSSSSNRFKDVFESKLREYAEARVSEKIRGLQLRVELSLEDVSFSMTGVNNVGPESAEWISDLEHGRLCKAVESRARRFDVVGVGRLASPLKGYPGQTKVELLYVPARVSLRGYADCANIVDTYSAICDLVDAGMRNLASANKRKFEGLLEPVSGNSFL